MSVTTVIALLGLVLSIIGSWSLFVLNQIRKSQDNTNVQIKEMNVEIKDTLIQLGRNDEKIINVNKRVDDLSSYVRSIDHRTLKMEQKSND